MKAAAAAASVAAGTWEGHDGGSPTAVARRLLGTPAAAPSGIGALTSGSAVQSTLEVVYPQTTGIDGDRAGVIALVRQVLRKTRSRPGPAAARDTRSAAVRERRGASPGG